MSSKLALNGGTETPSSSTPPESTTRSTQQQQHKQPNGSLLADVLGVYDLPYSDPPECVSVTIQTEDLEVVAEAKTGPPLARHKDRNSFRFSAPPPSSSSTNKNGTDTPSSSTTPTPPTSSSSSSILLTAPLRVLYKSTAKVKIIYSNYNSLEAIYDIHQLRIHESKWLILNLTPSSATATSDSANVSSSVNGTSATTNTPTTTTTTILSNAEELPPTIRIGLTLSGPYRPEIAALIGIAHAWFRLVDSVQHNAQQVWSNVPKPPLLVQASSTIASGTSSILQIMVLPAVPLVAIVSVATPFVAALAMIGLPFLLPIILLIITATAAIFLTGGTLYLSTSHGRQQFASTISPLSESFLSSRSGQSLVYDVGPYPTPVSVLKPILPTGLWGKLCLSLIIDMIGSSSYLLPIVGEGFDLIWAPIQTIFIMAMYDSTSPNLKYVSFAEELLPFTDIVPSATIGFLMEFVPQVLGGGKDNNNNNAFVNTSPEQVQALVQQVAVAIRGATTTTTTGNGNSNGATMPQQYSGKKST